jgi:hypothetical protein
VAASWFTRNARLLRLAPDWAISAPSSALGSPFAGPACGMTSSGLCFPYPLLDGPEDWMRAPDRKPLYRHIGVALLRAAAAPLIDALDRWPDVTDTDACREWLDQTWSRPDLADAGQRPGRPPPAPAHSFRAHLHGQRPPLCDGVLDGVAGIALTQHTAAKALLAFPWDGCLLIAPPTP